MLGVIHMRKANRNVIKVTKKLSKLSPELKGRSRSPFVDGLRSVSKSGPGKVRRALSGGKSSGSGSASLAFSVHA